jgi:hypothetical protein
MEENEASLPVAGYERGTMRRKPVDSAAEHEVLSEMLDDFELAKIIRARRHEKAIGVNLSDL